MYDICHISLLFVQSHQDLTPILIGTTLFFQIRFIVFLNVRPNRMRQKVILFALIIDSFWLDNHM